MEASTFTPADWREWRRLRALELKQQGWRQRDIASALDVSEVSVCRWLSCARQGGVSALSTRTSPGRLPKLALVQKCLIPEFLWHGAEAYGFHGEVWTCARIARVIQEEFGVLYHKDHVSRLLKELHWTPQVPIRRALQRDEDAIEQWRKEVWPRLLRQARRERRTLIFEDESGFYLLPGLVRTYAPQGQTPVIHEMATHLHLSVMGGMTLNGKIYTLVRQKSLNGMHCIAFFKHLLKVASRRLLVIWDGSPIHRRKEITAFVAKTKGTIQVEALPGYAPDLNPWDEGGWNHLKNVEMRNVPCRDLEEAHEELHLAVSRLRQKPHLVQSFFAQAGLKLVKT
jgi:transposase